jgi:hypothetical protein
VTGPGFGNPSGAGRGGRAFCAAAVATNKADRRRAGIEGRMRMLFIVSEIENYITADGEKVL